MPLDVPLRLEALLALRALLVGHGEFLGPLLPLLPQHVCAVLGALGLNRIYRPPLRLGLLGGAMTLHHLVEPGLVIDRRLRRAPRLFGRRLLVDDPVSGDELVTVDVVDLLLDDVRRLLPVSPTELCRRMTTGL